MLPSRVAALQAMPIFGGVRDDVLAGFIDDAATVTVAPGDFFFREGDKAEAMYVLERGKVVLLKHWEGLPHVLAELGVGDCFGEMALLDLFPRSASVQAVLPCSAIELNTAALFDLYSSHLESFALIQINIARELSRRLRAADEQLFRARVGAPAIELAWPYVS